MIYEDFNRPILVRWIEYIQFWITRKPHTLGIMQVTTNEYINDKDSILLAMQKINLDSITVIQKSTSSKFDIDHIAYLIANKYNPGDYDYDEDYVNHGTEENPQYEDVGEFWDKLKEYEKENFLDFAMYRNGDYAHLRCVYFADFLR